MAKRKVGSAEGRPSADDESIDWWAWYIGEMRDDVEGLLTGQLLSRLVGLFFRRAGVEKGCSQRAKL